MSEHEMAEVAVTGSGIRLGQLLKLADLVEDGGAAKEELAQGNVSVNGRQEDRRGAQLSPGDVVTVGARSVRLISAG